MQTKIKIN